MIEKSNSNTKFDFLSGGGETGKLIRSKDWSKTPLGSPDTWPQSLRTTVSLCIASNFPISITWGPHRVLIYNDGYWPVTGDKHPASMGQDFKECWLSAWPVIGQAFEEASLGQTRFLENQRIFIDRYGYLEETFFTFSFSPILDESGSVGGLFHPVIELTQQTIAERRLNILRVAADNTVNAKTVNEASSLILECLKAFELDLPFVLVYAIAADGKEANLQGNVGVERDSPLAPAKINLEVQHLHSWPFAEVIKNGKAALVEELGNIFGTFNCGPYAEPPKQAMVFPVTLHGTVQTNYFLVAGVSSRRSLDEKYLLFFELLAASIANALTKARAYEDERKKAEALAEIDKAKTLFFSNISHEFRKPLTIMLSPLEELSSQKKNNFSESEKQNIETTHRNAIRLLRLVNTLLDFSRIESGRVKAIFNLVDIIVFTKNLASNFRSVIEKAGLKFIIIADYIIQPVYVDKQMWEKIVFNLLSNAFKYTLKGKITVELSAEKDFAVLKVKDTGVGIPENELPKMFERFHRVQNVTGRTYEGTGIGLSLIKELVQMHYGTIDVESKLNEGSVFTVKIPFGKNHLNGDFISNSEIDSDEISSTIYVEEIETLLESQTKESLKPSPVKEKNILATVLVVDDNADMREHISSVLSNSFNVITANNGMDALHKMKETIPALVLSDIMMPVMDGIGLLKEIKSNKATANIPVIFLTARAGEESRIEGWETGADDYLVKPFSSKELVARVRTQINIVKLRQSLEGNVRNLFMEAPACICVLRGPEHIYELANDMYLQLIGNRAVTGKPIRQALPELQGQGFYEILDSVYTTGKPFIGNEMPIHLDKGNGKLEETYFNFVYQPSHNSKGEIDGIFAHGIDITEQVFARKKIEESEKQQAFLLKLSDALRPISNPVDIEEAATNIAMDFMDADRCHYSTIEEENVIILRDAFRGDLPSVAGVHPISSFPLYKAVLDAGRPFVVEDVRTNNIIDEDLKKLCLQSLYGSFINVPVIKNGKLVGLLSLVQTKSRKWTDAEVQLTRETAERTWAAVERAKVEYNLSKTEKQLRAVLEQAPLAIAITGAQGDIQFRNTMFDVLWGRPEHETEASKYSQVYTGFHLDGTAIKSEEWPEAKAIMQGEVVIEEVLEIVHQSGRKIPCSFNAGPIRNEDGKITGGVVLFRDVTAERTASMQLQESEEKYRTLFDSIDEGFSILEVLFDDQGKAIDYIFLEMNNAHEAITGLSRSALGMRISELMPDIEESLIERIGKVVLTGEPVRYEQYVSAWNRWFDVFSSRVGGHGSRKVANVFNNITERKQAEEKIKESESRFRTMADASPVLIWTIEANGLPSYYNKTFLDFIGVPKHEDISDWAKIVHPDDVRSTFDTINAAIAERRSYSLECRLLRADGHWRWVLAKGNPRIGAENEFLGFVGSSVDITERQEAEAKIKESEHRFHQMIFSSPSMIAILKGEDFIIEVANDAILDQLGKGKDIIGLPYLKAVPELEEQGFGELLRQVYKTGIPHHAHEMPGTMLHNGIEITNYYNFIYQAQRNIDNEIVGIAIIATAVTPQAEFNLKVKESELYFRRLTDTVPAIIWITEPDGTCSYLNKNWYSYTGQIEAEAKGFGWLDATHPDDKEETGRIFLEANAKQKPFIASYRLRVKNGDYRWAIDRGSPRYSEDGVYEGMIGTVVDVHEEKLAAEKMRDSEKQFSTLANNIQNLAWIADGEGWIYWYNQRWYDYTGTTLEEMKGWGWQKVHHPDHIERILGISKKLWRTNAPFELTFPLRRYDGEYRWFLTRGAPITDENGKIISWIGTNTDIEEQKNFSEQLEEKVNERTIQLNEVNENLEQKNIELQTMNKELEAFTYISSHDLQEPLRKIQTFAKRITETEKEHLSETSKDFFNRMNNAAARMQTLIQDLLAFSRISTAERKFEKTDLAKIVDEVKEEYKEAIKEKGATITTGVMCEANIIPFQLTQLIHNLISNSLKFANQDVPPRIIIKSELVTGTNSPFSNRDACHISVSDNGIGFEEHFSKQIFELFQRLHGKDDYAGTGIGLAIVKKIVDNHNGIITAESDFGKGATFNIYLPAS